MLKKELVICGAATSLGQPRSGVEFGPESIRASGLHAAARRLLYNIEDHGDLKCNVELPGDAHRGDGSGCLTNRPRSVGASSKLIHDCVRDGLLANKYVLVLGGDHSAAIGSISGVLAADPNACVIWVDAHGDINTPQTTETGNIHGMPVAFLADLGSVRDQPGFDWLEFGCLHRDRIAFIGLRDVDPDEQVVLKETGIASFSMHHVDKYGIAKVVAMALDAVNPDRSRRIHLSFDIDGLDPEHAPSTGTAVPGGLSLREGRYIAEALHATGKLTSMDMVEVNPKIRPDMAARTCTSAMLIIKAALGHTLTKE